MAATERPPLRGASVETRVLKVADGAGRERTDRLAGEEPLEIRAAGPGQEPVRVAVTMYGASGCGAVNFGNTKSSSAARILISASAANAQTRRLRSQVGRVILNAP